MKCLVCGKEGPNKSSQAARVWDWFTGYLKETVHFCPAHKNSPERDEMWRLSRIKAERLLIGKE